jgi:putative endonuclease
MFYVYVIYSEKVGKKYIGFTEDLELRLHQHNTDSLSIYTKNKGPWTLNYVESYGTKKEAILRERYLKTGAGRDFLKRKIGI